MQTARESPDLNMDFRPFDDGLKQLYKYLCKDSSLTIFIHLKSKFYFISYFLKATCNVSPTEKGGAENAKTRYFSKPK